MKLVLVSIATLLLGAAVGWRGRDTPAEGETLNQRQASEEDVEFAGSAEASERLGFGAEWRSWADRIREASSQAELEAIFIDFASEVDVEKRSMVALLLAARWAEVDAEKGVWFLEADGRGGRVLLELLTEWALRDQSAAMEGLEKLAGPGWANPWEAVVNHLMRRSPDAALAMMRSSESYVRYPSSPLKTLARERPEELAELIVEIETARLERGERYGAYSYLRALAEAFVERDPLAALKWAEGLDGRMRDTARQAVISHWARKDPIATAAYFEGTDEVYKHSDVSKALLKASMAQGDIAAAVEWARSRGTNGGGELGEVISKKIADGELGVRDAFDAVAGMQERDHIRDSVFQSMWGRLAPSEFEGALDALATAPEREPRQVAMGGLLWEWAKRDLEAAVAAVAGLPSGPARDEVMGVMAGGVPMAQHPVAAFSPADRPAVVAALFALNPAEGTVPAYSPSAIAGSLAEAPASEARAAATGRLARHWGAADPEAAMVWGESLPGSDAEAAVLGAAAGWAATDAFSLSNYLLEMPLGTSRDLATGALIDAVTKGDPDSAWRWADQIGDPEARSDARAGVVEAWAAEDPESAGAAIDAAELSAAEREALRAVIRR